MIYKLTDKLYFPPVENASPDGILAYGGDLSPERLMLSYRSGIFPWFSEGEPILWWSPPKRMVLIPDEIVISRSMQKIISKQIFKVTFNQEFYRVIENCRNISRNGQSGTWITDEMEMAYKELHKLGFAKSVEVWKKDELVGGLYGIDLGHVFAGESMFSKVSNASKFGFIELAKKLKSEGYKLLDCQVYNEHLESLGAREIARKEFMEILGGRL